MKPKEISLTIACIIFIASLLLLGKYIEDMKKQIEVLEAAVVKTKAEVAGLEKALNINKKTLKRNKEVAEKFRESTWKSFGRIRQNFLVLRYGKDGIQDIGDKETGVGGTD